MTVRISVATLLLCVTSMTFVACSSSGPSAPETQEAQSDPIHPPSLSADQPENYPGLHNVVAYADNLYSGGVPEGGEGFDSLAEMGIRTILSVDGAQPDVEAARAHGMRYVHLPIGYNGMDRQRTLEIARAVIDLPGPIYVHCHHGKHRSAGATGAAAVTLGLMNNDAALNRMKVSGTSPHYVGLYGCVAVASTASNAEILAASNTFPQRWKTTGLVRTMVEIDEVFEHLKRIQGAGWNVPAKHPDLVPVAAAGQMADLFRNLQDDERCREKPTDFMKMMLAASHDATAIESQLATDSPSMSIVDHHWQRLKVSCRDCHVKYRD